MDGLKDFINAVPFMHHPIINAIIIFTVVWLRIERYIINKSDK